MFVELTAVEMILSCLWDHPTYFRRNRSEDLSVGIFKLGGSGDICSTENK